MEWSNMYYKDKGLNIRQIAEGGYGWNWSDSDCKMDWLENLRTGYESDSEWFAIEVEADDWEDVFKNFAQELAEEINDTEYDFDRNDFEDKFGDTCENVAAKYIMQWHNEGISFNKNDVIFYMNDLMTKK